MLKYEVEEIKTDEVDMIGIKIITLAQFEGEIGSETILIPKCVKEKVIELLTEKGETNE